MQKLLPTICFNLLVISSVFFSESVIGQTNSAAKIKSLKGTMLVGVAEINITPDDQFFWQVMVSVNLNRKVFFSH